MQKLLAATLSALGLALVTATPDQAQAQMFTLRVSGQQSGSFTRTETRTSIVNGVPQPTITQTLNGSWRNVYPESISTQIGSNRNLQLVPPFISTPPVTNQFLNIGNFRNSVIVPQLPSISNYGGYQLNMNYLGR
jgi:hypothetical protein